MSEFLIKNTFNIPSVNALLDRMYFLAGQALPELDINTLFCLTGRAAAELQGAPALPCNQIVFLTNNAQLFKWMGYKLPKLLSAKGALRFKERVLLYLGDCVLEIWYQDEPINIGLFGGAYVQLKVDINEILL